ncbi:hypothetical protein [Cytobacillus sp. IB215665]|nr:hypothetical protein [Cytobacillus sp. IB215665]MDX8364389.1 hypothetical protein [Cytobacillus sp. IB215665]
MDRFKDNKKSNRKVDQEKKFIQQTYTKSPKQPSPQPKDYEDIEY